jgi:hypothetical protein
VRASTPRVVRARQRALNGTNIDIESIRKRTTGEAIVVVGKFAIRLGINILERLGFRPLKGAGMALNSVNPCRADSNIAGAAQGSAQFAEFIRPLSTVQLPDLASAGLTLVSGSSRQRNRAASRTCSVRQARSMATTLGEMT